MRYQSTETHIAIPSNYDIQLAVDSREFLASYLKSHKSDVYSFSFDKQKHETLKLSGLAVKMFLEVLELMAKGEALSIVPANKELTTQEAADLLNVSRPYLVQLLEDGKIPFRKVGTKRRILTQDIVAYKKSIDSARYKTLEKLSKQAQKLDMGYDVD